MMNGFQLYLVYFCIFSFPNVKPSEATRRPWRTKSQILPYEQWSKPTVVDCKGSVCFVVWKILPFVWGYLLIRGRIPPVAWKLLQWRLSLCSQHGDGGDSKCLIRIFQCTAAPHPLVLAPCVTWLAAISANSWRCPTKVMFTKTRWFGLITKG